MFQKVKQMCRKAKGFIQGVSTKVKMLALTLFSGTTAMAQSTAGDYSAGTTALSTVAEEIVKYVPVMVKLCYAIAGVVAIIGAISGRFSSLPLESIALYISSALKPSDR